MKTILIVDDSKPMRGMTQQTLSKNYNIIEAINGAHAIAKITELNSEIDLIISDVNMPEMNGIELLKKLKKMKSSIPLFFLSSEDENEFRKDCFELGACGWVQKPYKPDSLLLFVNTFFSG